MLFLTEAEIGLPVHEQHHERYGQRSKPKSQLNKNPVAVSSGRMYL